MTVPGPQSESGPPLLSIRQISKSFGSARVLNGITFDVAEGEFLTILGESGSGKTTLLRILAGFERPDSGEVWMAGQRFDKLPPNRRSVNTVFQHYALFPHLSVFENVAYGLRAKGTPGSEIISRVNVALERMNMAQFAQRKPAQLSGGQQQRVALARALINRPRMLLLDEPLSALDANLRRQMQLELKNLQREVGISFVFVTHDQEEAMTLSDRIALLRQGSIEQIGAPRELYDKPKTRYSATFVGQTNLLSASVREGMARVGALAWECALPASEATVSLRPEHVKICGQADPALPGAIRLSGAVTSTRFSGASELIEVNCGEGLLLNVRVPNGAARFDQPVLEILPEHLILLSE